MSILEHPHCCCDIRIGFFSSSRSSSGGLKKPRAGPRAKSLWGKSGRKPGGQIGHKGETLRRTAEPDRVAVHVPRNCGRCGSPVTEVVEAYTARQVFDLPQAAASGCHRAHGCCCGLCGAAATAEFPEGVTAPVRYGP